MRVLITDGDTRQALAATRSIGSRGHEIIVVSDRNPSLAGASRFALTVEQCTAPASDAGAYLKDLVTIVRRRSVDVVLPMTEISTLVLTQGRDQLPESCRLPFADYEAVLRASSKAEVLQLAQGLNVPVPASHIISSPLRASSSVDSLGFPLVIKPARSRVPTQTGWLLNSVSYASDADDLHRQLHDLPAESYPVLLQERIRGPGVGVFMLFDRGNPVAAFAHRRVREKPPSGGVSVLCESTSIDPTATGYAEKLLRRLGWHGPAMVEFKRDDRDGSLRLMEINGRFWGSLQLAIDAGVDFPALALEVAVGSNPRHSGVYRCGIRSRWLAGDLDALLLVLLKGRRRLHLPPGYPGKLRTLWNFLQLWGRDLNYEIERFDDLGPAKLEWRRRLGGG